MKSKKINLQNVFNYLINLFFKIPEVKTETILMQMKNDFFV